MNQLFLHGLGQTPASWDAVLRQLGCEETALCPDLAAMVSSEEATYGNLYHSVVRICKGCTKCDCTCCLRNLVIPKIFHTFVFILSTVRQSYFNTYRLLPFVFRYNFTVP